MNHLNVAILNYQAAVSAAPAHLNAVANGTLEQIKDALFEVQCGISDAERDLLAAALAWEVQPPAVLKVPGGEA